MCEGVRAINRTQTATGTDTQFVMKSASSLGAKCIYARNGTVYALRD